MAGHADAVAVVLDNEAVQALADPHHPKHRRALSFVDVAQRRSRAGRPQVAVLVPVAVRVEAGWARRDARAALVNRLQVRDVELRGERVDRAVRLARTAGATAVDATVGEAALAAGGPAVILTSDVGDMQRLAAQGDHEIRVVRL
jgi:hypothetical protein